MDDLQEKSTMRLDDDVQKIMSRLFEPMVLWCVRSGIGYAGVVELMRELFTLCAYQELVANKKAVTDDALSLASGVHKSAVRDFKKKWAGKSADELKVGAAVHKVSFSDRVMARWLALGWPSVLSLKKDKKSFKNLCEVSADRGGGRSYAFIPPVSLILEDMERRGLVKQSNGNVERLRDVARASIHDLSVSAYVADVVSDYMYACLENIQRETDEPVCLEQSIVVDELPKASYPALDEVVRRHWKSLAQVLIDEATRLCEEGSEDVAQNAGETTRVRIGFYCCDSHK